MGAQWTAEDTAFMRGALVQVRRRRAVAAALPGRLRTSCCHRSIPPPPSMPQQQQQQACRALEEGETPVGCVVVRDGAVAATGSNKTNESRNVRRECAFGQAAQLVSEAVPSQPTPPLPPLHLQGTRHAEFVAIDQLLAEAGGDAAAARFDK